MPSWHWHLGHQGKVVFHECHLKVRDRLLIKLAGSGHIWKTGDQRGVVSILALPAAQGPLRRGWAF